MDVVFYLLLGLIVAYFFLRKRNRFEFVMRTHVNDDLFGKYSELIKEATALKKAGKIEDAIEKIKAAYKEAEEKQLTLTAKDYLKLPPYLQKAGRNDEAWGWFNLLIQKCASDSMSLSEIYNKMCLFRQREDNDKDAIKYAVLSSLYWCLGLHQQVTQLGWDDRKPELVHCKKNMAEGYGKMLKKAGCEHLEEPLKKIIKEHMKQFPDIRLPELIRDINNLVTKN